MHMLSIWSQVHEQAKNSMPPADNCPQIYKGKF